MLLTISASVFAGRFAIRLATSCAKAVALALSRLPTRNPAHRRSRSSGRWGGVPYDVLASEELITLLVERHMRFFSIRDRRFKPGSILCDLFAGPKNLGFEDAS